MALPRVVIVLAWLHCMAGFGIHNYEALAKPIEPPDVQKCQAPETPPGVPASNCCPPKSTKIVDFKPLPSPTLRVRPAAHLVDDHYVRKYRNATKLMKRLDKSHPWHFIQQANIHCAYCDGAYNQTSYPNLTLQVHGSWLFFPFHRAYLYFYERILGNLIGDDTFALPFWNWDAPDGMTIPAMYTVPNSALYDKLRDPTHQPPNVTDYSFEGGDPLNRSQVIAGNLNTMYQQMVTGSRTAELFLGSPYRAGDDPYTGSGSLETGPHGTVHVWTGEDMSALFTAARDPIFFAHHGNVDRMWEVWKHLPGGNRKNFNDTDFLDAAFIFWDENQQLVRIKVRDVLDTRNLGYVYQDVALPWLNASSGPRELEKPMTVRMLEFPLSLDAPVRVEVTRPDAVRSRENKEKEEEVLVVDEIELDHGVHARFDVFVSAAKEDDSSTTMSGRFAGSFVHVPMGRWRRGGSGANMMRTRLRLGLTGVLEDLGASGDGSVSVTFIPRTLKANMKVGAVRIETSA